MVSHINLPIFYADEQLQTLCVCVSAFVCEPLKFTHPAGQIYLYKIHYKLETPTARMYMKQYQC